MLSTPCTVGTVEGALMPIPYIILAPFSTVARKLTIPLGVKVRNGVALAKHLHRPPSTIPLQYRDASSVLTYATVGLLGPWVCLDGLGERICMFCGVFARPFTHQIQIGLKRQNTAKYG